MKILLTTTEPNLDADLDPRFGRCAYLLIVDPTTMEWQARENPAASAGGGAGVQAAQLVSNLEVKAVISGQFGPNAFDALRTAGIEMYQFGICQSVNEAIQGYLAGELPVVNAATRGEGHSRGRFRA